MNVHKFMVGLCAFGLIFSSLIISVSHAESPKFIFVGTGGVTGVYYPAAGAICRIANNDRKKTGVRCSVESTQGSLANLDAVADGYLDLAIAQSDTFHDVAHNSKQADSHFIDKNLRSVFNLYQEPFTVVARAGSGIHSFDDLAGKRINIGNPGSGQRQTMEVLMKAKGWTSDTFKATTELSSVDHSDALCNDKIDAYVFSSGHPSGSLKHAANTCEVSIVPVNGPTVDRLISENSAYSKAVVPGRMYRGTAKDIPTLSVTATLMASANSDSEAVYSVVKSVFENLDMMREMHPALNALRKDSMIAKDLGVPTHEGALKYYKEVGFR